MNRDTKKSFLERGIAAHRNLIALCIIVCTIIGITIISVKFFSIDSKENAGIVFNALLPLFATWVGTVLAFYFGRENFEIASERYEEVIRTLTPDLLDDISVTQIMITTKTMVSKKETEYKDEKIYGVNKFLNDVNKSRLPIFDDKGKVKYIVHKSTLSEFIAKDPKNVEKKFSDFIKEKETLLKAETILEDKILEDAINLMTKENVKDVFVVDSQGKVVGWITDTLAMRYINTSKTS